ncbi:MAG: sucrose phosphorylase [Pseudomonadota bacterium]|nr:sucrose phosphorylase [Pseudomonadota bacterium]
MQSFAYNAAAQPARERKITSAKKKNQVQLITYVDRLGGGGLPELTEMLRGPLRGVFGAVHLLPFYHPIDGSDAGFDPIDHTIVDPRLGDWRDVAALARTTDVIADLIVNHMSDRSPQFLDFVRRGRASAYDGLFLTREAVFPGGASQENLAKIYRPRPGSPFREITLENGERRCLWTTFTPRQIDIDVMHPLGQAYLEQIISTLAANGVRTARFDAVGYAIKKAGTSCFMLPETLEFIDAFAARCRALGVEVLIEVHSHYRRQIEIAKRVDWVYDFALPPLVLHAFAFGTAAALKAWIEIRPSNAITVLDTHDGIGIIDISADAADPSARPGLLPPEDIHRLVEHIHEASGGASRQATGAAASNLDLYQVNCTFFDAIGRDQRRYLLARAIQFFLPGIPQVYYMGLLAGHNDMELLARTGVGRDINRHYYDRAEFDAALELAVVQDLLALISLRNEHPAFNGRFSLADTEPSTLALGWQKGDHQASLTVNFSTAAYELRYSAAAGEVRLQFR